jgi:hypothetical protein
VSYDQWLQDNGYAPKPERPEPPKKDWKFNPMWALACGGALILGLLAGAISTAQTGTSGNGDLFGVIGVLGVLGGSVGLVVCLILAIASRK